MQLGIKETKMFFRLQQAGLTLEQMKSHKSIHGVDDDGEFIYLDAVAASDSCTETNFGGSCEDEVVVFDGQVIESIYDGVVVYPTQIVARYEINHWLQMVEDGETEMYD